MDGQSVEDALFVAAVQVVHHVGHIADAAHLDVFVHHDAGELFAQLCFHQFDGSGGSALHFGDALHHFHLFVAVQPPQHSRCFFRCDVREHQGDGLGPFVLQSGVKHLFIRFVQKGELPVFQRPCHFVQQIVGLLFPVGFFQHCAGVLQPTFCDGLVGHAHLVVFVEHVFRLVGIQKSQSGHFQRQLFHVVRVHELVQLRGFVRPQRYDDSRRFLLGRQRLMAFFGFGHILHCGGADRRRVLLLLHLGCRFGISHWSRRLLSAKT